MANLTKTQRILARAVLLNDLEGVEASLSGGIDINFLVDTEIGEKPLISMAIRSGSTDMIKLLLEQKPVLNESDAYGNTPLIEAVSIGNTSVVKALLDAGADANMKVRLQLADGHSETSSAVHTAALNERIAIVNLLQAKGAKIDETTADILQAFEIISGTQDVTQNAMKSIISMYQNFFNTKIKIQRATIKAEQDKDYLELGKLFEKLDELKTNFQNRQISLDELKEACNKNTEHCLKQLGKHADFFSRANINPKSIDMKSPFRFIDKKDASQYEKSRVSTSSTTSTTSTNTSWDSEFSSETQGSPVQNQASIKQRLKEQQESQNVDDSVKTFIPK